MPTPVRFHLISYEEHKPLVPTPLDPLHRNYDCGSCGRATCGCVVADLPRNDGSVLYWCYCSCPRQEPAVLLENKGVMIAQYPEIREFHPAISWPGPLAKLYDEAAKAYSAGAYTAAAMVCRKVLMAVACHEGDGEGKSFTAYVDYITSTVLVFPKAKPAIDAIRDIGNDANHEIDFVVKDDAKRAMQIVVYLLNAVYSMPTV